MQKLVKALIQFTPSGLGLGTTAHALWTHQWTQAIILSLLTGCTSLWVKFSSKFMEEAEKEAEKRGGSFAQWLFTLLDKAVDALRSQVSQLWLEINSDFEAKYFKRLKYICRNYETQGLDKGQVLNLQQVIVSVGLSQRDLVNISPNLLQTLKNEEQLNRQYNIGDMLAWMKPYPEDFRCLAILGAPGSGKTTLMRYLTLMYATRQQRQLHPQAPKLIPVLLYLREIYPRLLPPKTPGLPPKEQPMLAELLNEWVQGLQTVEPLKPPANWFAKQLKQGRCLILLDGLDEVPDEQDRQTVSRWVDDQIANYMQTSFILTSRKAGYESAQLQQTVRVLEVQPFTNDQIQKFVNTWYLETEVKAQMGEADLGVREEASRQASNLLQEIDRRPALAHLATNPLLLTMIATVHRRGSSLPLNRVALYKEICQVLLEKRERAKATGTTGSRLSAPAPLPRYPLSAHQKQVILQPLALELTRRETLKFTLDSVHDLLQSKLQTIPGETLTPVAFLRQLRDVDALLAKEQEGIYEFAHRSFQEYLTAAEIKDIGQERLLLDILQTPDKLEWWAETMRLYAAQTDASKLIHAIVQQPTFETLLLACDFWQEGLTVSQNAQQALLQKLNTVLVPLDPETRQLAEQLQPRYYKLAYYLQTGQWREADRETYEVMREVGDRTRKGYLSLEDIQQFPCHDLRILDRLWVNYSKTKDYPNGKWGFSVQKEIWIECDRPTDYNDEKWLEFCDRVGWRTRRGWVNDDDLTFDLQESLRGEFPFFWWGVCGLFFGGLGLGVFLFSRAETCRL